MFKKSSWSRRLLLTAVAVSQLMSSVAPVKAMWSVRSYDRAWYPDDYDEPSAAAPAVVPSSLEPLDRFLERLSTLSPDEQLRVLPQRWADEESVENCMALLPALFDLAKSIPNKLHPWKHRFLTHVPYFFDDYQTQWFWRSQRDRISPESWLRGTDDEVKRQYRLRIAPFLGEIFADPQEPIALRNWLARHLAAFQGYTYRMNQDGYKEIHFDDELYESILPFFKRILEEFCDHESFPELQRSALTYVWGLSERSPGHHMGYERRREKHEPEVALVNFVSDRRNPEDLRCLAIDYLTKTKDQDDLKKRYAEKLHPIYCQILTDPRETESLRTFLTSEHKNFLWIFPGDEETGFQLMLMSRDLVKDPSVPDEVRCWAARYLWLDIGSSREAFREKMQVEDLFFDIIRDPTETRGFKGAVTGSVLNLTFPERRMRAQSTFLKLVNLIRETDDVALKAQILDILWSLGDQSPIAISRDDLLSQFSDFLQMIAVNAPGPILLPFVLRSIATAPEEKKQDVIRRLKCVGNGNSAEMALGEYLEEWMKAGGTVEQPLDLTVAVDRDKWSNSDKNREYIFTYYIFPLLVSGEMRLMLTPPWPALMKEFYPHDEDFLAEVGLIYEQRTLVETLQWLREAPQEDVVDPDGSCAGAPLPVVMLAGVVLEDTMLRRRVGLVKATNPA